MVQANRMSLRRIAHVIAPLFALSVLAACGGGDAGGAGTNSSSSTVTPTYSIIASIAGLSGSGLVLQNNGGNDFLVNGADGRYVINRAAPLGSAYNFTVKTQPTSPSQTCVVTNGSGTVAGADVTIAVACTTNTYAITATVSGLAGAGLILQNNGANYRTFASNGAFTIDAAAASASAYNVTVNTQPTNPSQTCVVVNGSGTIVSTNVNIAVNCTTNTYAIKAVVSGLVGTGLVLQNNGANNLMFNSGEVFTINPAVASGSAYNVTVNTQPTNPSQTCVVVNGSGTVAGANVTIPVSCTTNTYAIKATVSGLVGIGLVLQNNGANNLMFNSSGVFTINPAVASGSAYNVTVNTQPTHPSQTCVVVNGSGTVASANVNIAVNCTTNTYAITATVSGLIGTGLILQNNDASDLIINANGTFTINAAVASGTLYKVGVKTQPTNPSQLCGPPMNGSYLVESANVNIAVTCNMPDPPTILLVSSMRLNVIGTAESKTTGSIFATDAAGRQVTYSIATPASKGIASVNSNTGVMTYTLAGYPSPVTATSDSFVVSASNGYSSASLTIAVSLNSDPLLPNQWHLQNAGQYTFSDTRPTPGFDVNVTGAWQQTYSGLEIKIAVVDTGLDINHEDLSANVDVANSINFIDNGTNPSSSLGFDHGTMVAGIIGAVGFNGKGGRGIAYGARLRGYNFLASQSLDSWTRSFGGDARSSDNDIFNASFGRTAPQSLPSYNNAFSSVLNGTTSLRAGRGAVVIMSAGNDFQACAQTLPVSCGSPAADSYKQSIVPIIVGALAADGTKASYSNAASSLWVSAPGGEYGHEAQYAGTSNIAAAFAPAITTTTTTGCDKYTQSFNALDSRGANALATQCQYTATMNGSSAAAPMVSGVAALMLEANRSLGYRDIAHILAVTAKKVDTGFSGVSATLAGASRQLEQGWTTNAAGYSFSNRYGFGAVDASAAVSMARTYTSYLPATKLVYARDFLAAGDVSIGPNGKFVSFPISDTITKTEKVFVLVNVYTRNYGALGALCNQIELTSPAGTKSILLNAANGFQNSQLADVLFSSNAFYGENPNGTWKLSVFDWCDSTPVSPTMFSLTKPQQFAVTGY